MKNKRFLGITVEYWKIIMGLFVIVFILCYSFKMIGNYSWLTVTKLGISIMGIVMTFIVFMRSFEVFEETQKKGAQDNVNKNFYAMLEYLKTIQAETTKLKYDNKLGMNPPKEERYSVIDGPLESINKYLSEINQKTVKEKEISEWIRIEISFIEDELFRYFTLLNKIVFYLNKEYRNETISESDFKMYMSVLSSLFNKNEMTIILLYSLYSH